MEEAEGVVTAVEEDEETVAEGCTVNDGAPTGLVMRKSEWCVWRVDDGRAALTCVLRDCL